MYIKIMCLCKSFCPRPAPHSSVLLRRPFGWTVCSERCGRWNALDTWARGWHQMSRTLLSERMSALGDLWARHFLDSSIESDINGKDWSSEFLKETTNLHTLDNPIATEVSFTHRYDNKWAEEYLSGEVPLLKQVDNEDGALAEIANKILDATKDNDLFSESSFFNFLSEVGSGDSRLIDGNFVRSAASNWTKEFNANDKTILAPESTQWAEEFGKLTESDFESLTKDGGEAVTSAYKQDFWQNLDEEWQNLASTKEHPWLSEFETEWEPFKNYEFREENPLKDHPNALEEGKIRLAQGDIPSAVLLFEAAVQQNPESGEAWTLLGMTQAKNEQDPAAISALRRAIALDPEDAKNSLMALAVSYTNESYQAQACRSLQEWIHKHPTYSHLGDSTGSTTIKDSTSSFMSTELHSETIDMFLGAARLAASDRIDPDVQCGLGILFNLSGDYDKAVDCFRAALQVRPNDALIWNKLGATLANGNRSEEAVSAYHSALQYSPGFIRCRYNLGISCINLKAYTEAAQHFLTALNFQSAGRGPQGEASKSVMSDSIWSSLRLSISLMDRKDLFPSLDDRDLEKLSRELGLKQS